MDSGAFDGPGQPGRSPLPPHLDPRRGARPAPAGTGPRGPLGPLPHDPGPRPRGRARGAARVLSYIAVALSGLIFVGSGLAYLAYAHYNGQITRVRIHTTGSSGADIAGQNFLLVGSDSRNGATAAQLHLAGTTADGGGTNTDTIILLHIAPHGGHVTFVSFPRDSYVQIPGHGMNKINAAYGIGESVRKGGGPDLLVKTVESLSGLKIDHYLQVTLFGFMDISNAIGGVDVCLKNAVQDSYTGLNLSAGHHTIAGNVALAFVRQRHGLPLGDLDRIKRQQAFIGAVVRKVQAGSTLANPFTLNALLNAATKALTADSGLGISDMRNLATHLRHLDPSHVTFTTLPVANIGGVRPINGYNASVVLLDLPKLPAFFDAIEGIPTPAAPAATAGSGTPQVYVAPGGISVTVLNASGVTGKARSTGQSLAAYGFQLAGVGTAAVGPTVIRYGSAKADSARTLGAAVPGAVLQLDPALGSTLVLQVGTNFAGVQAPTAANASAEHTGGAAASATPSAAATTPASAAPAAGAANGSTGLNAVNAAQGGCVD